MRKHGKIMTLAIVAILACIATSALREDPGPVADTRTLSEWLWLISYKNLERNEHLASGTNAIAKIGTNALPYLVRWARYEPAESRVKETARNLLGSYPALMRIQPLSKWAYLDDKLIRANGIPVAFRVLGPLANPAIEELIAAAPPGSVAEWCATNTIRIDGLIP